MMRYFHKELIWLYLTGILYPLLGSAAPEIAPAEIQPMASQSLLLDIQLAGDRLVAVGERGHILLSDDSGNTWRQVPVPTRATLTALSFADERNGWVVGHENTLLHTADGGETWTHQTPPGNIEQSLLTVLFTDNRTGFAMGAYGVALRTRDGGQVWRKFQILDEDLHLNRLTIGADDTLYLAVESGVVMRSEDSGNSWEEMDFPYDGSIFGILPMAGKNLLAYGLRGNIFRSTDQGDSWQDVSVETPTLLAHAIRTSSGATVVAGQNGHFFISRDGGRTFTHWQQPQVRGVAALVEAPDGTLIAVGPSGAHRIQLPTHRGVLNNDR